MMKSRMRKDLPGKEIPGSVFTTECEKGQRIIDFLRKELGLPKILCGFELHISKDNDFVFMVKNLSYYPEDDKKGKQ